MVKVLISVLTFTVLTVTATQRLLDNAFTPVNSGFNPKVVLRNLVVTKSSIPEFEVAELSEKDFIPTFANDALLEDEQPVEFLSLSKSIKMDNIQAERADLDNRLIIKKMPTQINGAEPIVLSGYNTLRKIKFNNLVANFKPLKVDLIRSGSVVAEAKKKKDSITTKNVDKSINVNLDRISTALSATEKSNQKEKLNVNIDKGNSSKDELVFFDYSNSPDEKSKTKVSNSLVGQSIPIPNKGGARDEVLGKILKDMGEKFKKDAGTNVSMNGPSKIKVKAPVQESYGLNGARSSLRVATHGYSLTSRKSQDISDFDIRFADNADAIAHSGSDGSVLIESNLNSEYSVRRAVLFSHGYLPVSVDLVLEQGNVNLGIPTISKTSFNKVLEEKGLRGLGSHALIELDELTEDADFDVSTGYELKLFLDRNLNIVNRGDSEYAFILFIGVEPGNRILSFKTYKNEITSKIVHLVEDELYFDFNFYHRIKNDKFALFEDNLLSQESGVLSLDENQITDLGYESKITKKTVNEFSIDKALYSIGTRKYFELKHQGESIFIGRWNNYKINVPSESYKRFALGSFDFDSLNGHCMVQINLSKQAKAMSFNGSSFRGSMSVEQRVLDTDGIFYRDLSNQSKKIFLMGEEQGVINVEITYVDNTVDYLQSFCSQSNYLVEQL